jgi:hypothetical protein
MSDTVATYRRHRVGIAEDDLQPNRHLVGLCDGTLESLAFVACEVSQAVEEARPQRGSFSMPKRVLAVEQQRNKAFTVCLLIGIGDIIFIFASLALAGPITPGLWLTYLVVGLFPNLMFIAAVMFPLRWLQTAALCSCFLYAFIVIIDTRGVLMLQFVFAFLEVFGLVRLRSLSEPVIYFL